VLHLVAGNPENISEIKIHILSLEICVLYIIEKMNFLSSFFRPSIRIEGIQGKCTILEENISCENLRTRGNCARLKCHMHKDSRRNTEYLYPMENLNSLNGTNANSRTMASATAIRWGGGRRITKRAPKRNKIRKTRRRNKRAPK
jgi:hypothetical protein